MTKRRGKISSRIILAGQVARMRNEKRAKFFFSEAKYETNISENGRKLL
jgi:hypothetical protein